MEGVELWAQRRQLPGIGVADLLDYRQEHPEVSWFQSWILSTTRECGISFASALRSVMEGIPNLKTGRMTLEKELKEFHEYHKKLGSDHFQMLPSEDFMGLDDYIESGRPSPARQGCMGSWQIMRVST
eukprot:Skav233712  [mRNA]  locus=scaffold2120:143016:146162:+ [translate_table: standard]